MPVVRGCGEPHSIRHHVMLDISTVGKQAKSCDLSRALWSQQDPRGNLGGPVKGSETDSERASTGEGWRLQAVRVFGETVHSAGCGDSQKKKSPFPYVIVFLGACQVVGCFL